MPSAYQRFASGANGAPRDLALCRSIVAEMFEDLRIPAATHKIGDRIYCIHYRMGGIWLPVLFGTSPRIEMVAERQWALDLLLFGAIVIIGLYNLGLFVRIGLK